MVVLKPLGNTFIFKEYDKRLNLTKKMISFILDGSVVTIDQIHEQIGEIEKRYMYHLKNEIIDAVKTNVITPIICQTTTKLPNMIPVFAARDKKGIVNFYVNLTNYSNVARDGRISIDTKCLYTLLQTGLIYKVCFYNLISLQKQIKFNRSASYVYATMFTRVLNKTFSLNTFPDKYDEIMYLSSKFFLINLMQREENDIVNTIAASNCKDISKLFLDDLDKTALKESTNPYTSIDNLIQFISSNITGLDKLNVRGFLDAYIIMYSAGSLMALEYLPFFLHTIFSVVIGSFMVNQYSFETMTTSIDEVINDFAYIIKH